MSSQSLIINLLVLLFFSIIVDAAGDGEIGPDDGPGASIIGSIDNVFKSVKDFDQE
jgi:hypothetical protein